MADADGCREADDLRPSKAAAEAAAAALALLGPPSDGPPLAASKAAL